MQLATVFIVIFALAINAYAIPPHKIEDYWSFPHYSYHYGVHDPKHHDVHEQREQRHGDKVEGHYSLVQPDGRKRIVHYESDKHGTNYKVRYEGHAIHEEGHHHGGDGGYGGGGHAHGHGHAESFIEYNVHAGHPILVKGVGHVGHH